MSSSLPASTAVTAPAAAVALPSPSSLPFPKVGVSMEVFDMFIEECGGVDALQGLTTSVVCERFLKPLTSEKRVSYCELKALDDVDDHIATATVVFQQAYSYFVCF